MSKALDIRKEAQARIVAADFADTVVRRKRDFNADEVPAVCLYLGQRTVRSSQGNKYIMDAQLAVEYHKSVGNLDDDEIDDLTDTMILTVRDAMEIDPRQLANKIVLHPGLVYESDEIEGPDGSGNHAVVRVIYNVPHIETHGTD